jgi:hypothetical protein
MNRWALRALVLAAVAVVVAGVAASSERAHATTSPITFGGPQYVDTTLAGGEPIVMADPAKGTIVYTSHEGTTHLYRDGYLSSPFGDFSFAANYCNQVNIWVSSDGGTTWQRDHYLNAVDPCSGLQTNDDGFSDPDLTMDASGTIYNTGINLVNDSVFASTDGGRTWTQGTSQCHDGDRPWLAGGNANEVFMTTDPAEDVLNHAMFVSEDGGQTCSTTEISDYGTMPDGSTYDGQGKLYMDPAHHQKIAEPVLITEPNGQFDLGVSTWQRGDTKFTPHVAVRNTSLNSHWPALAIDRGNFIYLVWDTAAGNGKPNKVMMTVSRDFGQTFSPPTVIAAPTRAQVFWPWVTAGSVGRVSIVWYQTNPGELGNIDSTPVHVSIYEESIIDGTRYGPINAAGRPIHVGTICTGGTTCVATGEDRRLGDFFTNALTANGCVMIASGDTMLTDALTGEQLPTSRPIFIKQTSGPSLYKNGSCG